MAITLGDLTERRIEPADCPECGYVYKGERHEDCNCPPYDATTDPDLAEYRKVKEQAQAFLACNSSEAK